MTPRPRYAPPKSGKGLKLLSLDALRLLRLRIFRTPKLNSRVTQLGATSLLRCGHFKPAGCAQSITKASATFILSVESIAVSNTCIKTAERLLLSSLVLRSPSKGLPFQTQSSRTFMKYFSERIYRLVQPIPVPSQQGIQCYLLRCLWTWCIHLGKAPQPPTP
ncbi:hypothetical protein SAICODRAFT_200585 [Saitoella complicata NRRL Y-17804]|nr:uncharacterized protein SAICODRAFT_200585 [Saitoella complicata NRRL Y-17804]ODQ55187.1 hypothetical protein SAICODRAFT_200585 [Saitoella complicata NRRL Y-17804]